MNILKKLLKKGMYALVPIFGGHKLSLGQHKLLILTYHRILPEEDQRIKYEQPGMYVKPGTFEQHIQLIKQHFDIVKLNEWLQNAAQPKAVLPKQACAITFDDGWQDNYQYAFPILKKYNAPATIFLVSNLIGSGDDFWPGRLAKLLHSTALNHHTQWSKPAFNWLKADSVQYHFNSTPPSNEELDEIINHCKSFSDKQNHTYIDAAVHTLNIKLENTRVLLNKQEVKEMLESELIDIGSHTQNHIRLSNELEQNIIEREIIDSKRDLENLFDTSVSLFCYPNGDTTETSINLVKHHYNGACTTSRGWNTRNSPSYQLKRISMHEDMTNTASGFLTKISGWL